MMMKPFRSGTRIMACACAGRTTLRERAVSGCCIDHDGRADRRPWRVCGLVRAVAPRRVVCVACRRLAPERGVEQDREAGTIEASVMMWARSKASTAWWASP